MKLKLKKALLIVDPQNDFCSKGALPVPGGDEIIKDANRYIKLFSEKRLPVFISRDWHPKKSVHFKKFGGKWPAHCVQDTKGAEFHPALKIPKDAIIISKGMDPQKDTYSDFESTDTNDTPFINLLKIFGVQELYVGGLATDYCVKHTVLDALKAGFKVRLLMDAIKGVDVRAGDSKNAVEEMLDRGAVRTTFLECLA